MSSALFIFVELDMQNLPVAYADAGVTALMALVAIVTAKVLHLTLSIDSDFINGKEADCHSDTADVLEKHRLALEAQAAATK